MGEGDPCETVQHTCHTVHYQDDVVDQSPCILLLATHLSSLVLTSLEQALELALEALVCLYLHHFHPLQLVLGFLLLVLLQFLGFAAVTMCHASLSPFQPVPSPTVSSVRKM